MRGFYYSSIGGASLRHHPHPRPPSITKHSFLCPWRHRPRPACGIRTRWWRRGLAVEKQPENRDTTTLPSPETNGLKSSIDIHHSSGFFIPGGQVTQRFKQKRGDIFFSRELLGVDQIEVSERRCLRSTRSRGEKSTQRLPGLPVDTKTVTARVSVRFWGGQCDGWSRASRTG